MLSYWINIKGKPVVKLQQRYLRNLIFTHGEKVMSDFERALADPSSEYNTPNDVLLDENLTKEQKIKILKHWHHDALEIMRADEENMSGDSENMLNRVLVALHRVEESD